MPADAAPAKVLRIALQPEALGRVTVQLLARGDSLHVAIAADHAETAVLLERDRHALARLLDASGLKVDEASIRISAADPTPARTPADPAVMQPAPQFASGPAAGGGAEGGRGGAARPKDKDAAPHREEEENALESDPRRPLGALYV
jgi:ribosomal protein L12E/L44/L45/RPP1/RPP2